MREFDIIGGDPGARWRNGGQKILWQFRCQFNRSCARCIQLANLIGPYWPLPIHHKCVCQNVPVAPGQFADPFLDFVEEVRKLEPAQQAVVMGRSNWALVDAGVVKWEDVVTRARIRSFREVVHRERLGADALVKAGVRRHVAEKAIADTSTAPATQAEQARRAMRDILLNHGLTVQEIAGSVGGRLKLRVGVRGGPGGPSRAGFPGPSSAALAIVRNALSRVPDRTTIPPDLAAREIAKELGPDAVPTALPRTRDELDWYLEAARTPVRVRESARSGIADYLRVNLED